MLHACTYLVRIICSAPALEQGMEQMATMKTQGRRELLALPAVNAASAHARDTDAVISEEKEECTFLQCTLRQRRCLRAGGMCCLNLCS